MRQRQLLTFGLDDVFAQRLHDKVQDLGIGLRKTHQPAACLNLLRQGAIGVVVLHVGRHLESEYTLLSQVATLYPRVATLVLGDSDHPSLASLAWDLGARCVLVGPPELERVYDVVVALFGTDV